MKHLFSKYLPEKGQGLVEYALLLVLIAVVVIGIVSLLGPTVGGIFSRIVGVFGESSITIKKKGCEPAGGDKPHVDAQYKGGYDATVTLTISPPVSLVEDRQIADGDSWDGYHFQATSGNGLTCSSAPTTFTITATKGGQVVDTLTVTVP